MKQKPLSIFCGTALRTFLIAGMLQVGMMLPAQAETQDASTSHSAWPQNVPTKPMPFTAIEF